MSLSRRVPANAAAIVFMLAFLVFWFRPSNRFSHLDRASLALYLNSSHTVQKPQSVAWGPAPDCEALSSVISTTTEMKYVTTTETAIETATCPLPAAAAATPPAIGIPGGLASKGPNLEPTAEQEVVGRLRDQGIVIIFKTGAQEVSHLSIQVGTTLRYLDPADILFFSDLQGALGPFLINDALRNVDQTIKESDADFQIYRDIRRYQRTGQDIEELKEERSKGDGRSGWRLDKYKFLHMVEETFEMRPNAKWYVFIETDSYVVWSNLAEWLGRLDHTKPMYMGAPVYIGETAFGHGGSGYVLSNAAMNKLLGPDQPQGLAATWDQKMKEVCCGDLALALALLEKGIPISGTHPLTNGDKPATMSFGPGQLWCLPVVTMHHVLPHEISAIWRYERKREILDANSNATIFADLYFHFVEPHLVEARDNWDNMAHGRVYSEEETKKIEDQLLEKQREKDEEDGRTEDARNKQEQLKLEEDSVRTQQAEKAAADTAAAKETEKKQKAMEEDESDRQLEAEDTVSKDASTEATKPPSEDANVPDGRTDDPKNVKDAEITEGEQAAKDEEDSNSKRDSKIATKKATLPPLSAQAPHGKRNEPLDDRPDVEREAHLSFENCAKACEAYERCFQYVYSENVCTLGESVRLGKYAKPDGGDGIATRSGWNLARIRAWTSENACHGPEWPSWAGSARQGYQI